MSTLTTFAETVADGINDNVPLPAGTTFANGDISVVGIRAHGFNHGAVLTIVRSDKRCYGVTRYVVRDAHGRHGYAY